MKRFLAMLRRRGATLPNPPDGGYIERLRERALKF